MSDPLHRLPDHVTVSITELRAAISDLEDLLDTLDGPDSLELGSAHLLDRVIGRMTRWIWPLLEELDREDGYDE